MLETIKSEPLQVSLYENSQNNENRVITTILNSKFKLQDYCRLRSNFINAKLLFHQDFQTLDNNRIHSTAHQTIFIVLLKLQNTQDRPFRSSVFIVFRVSQILENNVFMSLTSPPPPPHTHTHTLVLIIKKEWD